MLCEPIIQSICIPGLGFAITLSKHEAFLAYRYKCKQRLESKQLESLGRFVILMLEWIMCRYWHIWICLMFLQPWRRPPRWALLCSVLCAVTSLRAQECASNAPFAFCYCCCERYWKILHTYFTTHFFSRVSGSAVPISRSTAVQISSFSSFPKELLHYISCSGPCSIIYTAG